MAEVVNVVKYKSLNGQMYDSESAATRADAAWRKENEYDLAQEIASYQSTGERFVARSLSKWNNNLGDFPKLLVEHSKYGDSYHLIKTPHDYADAFYSVFENRKGAGYYEYSSKDSVVAEEILRNKNKSAAIAYVQERKEHEYEGVDIETMYQYSRGE